jgi:hypothetical protein
MTWWWLWWWMLYLFRLWRSLRAFYFINYIPVRLNKFIFLGFF